MSWCGGGGALGRAVRRREARMVRAQRPRRVLQPARVLQAGHVLQAGLVGLQAGLMSRLQAGLVRLQAGLMSRLQTGLMRSLQASLMCGLQLDARLMRGLHLSYARLRHWMHLQILHRRTVV